MYRSPSSLGKRSRPMSQQSNRSISAKPIGIMRNSSLSLGARRSSSLSAGRSGSSIGSLGLRPMPNLRSCPSSGPESTCPPTNLRPRPMRRASSPPGAMGRSCPTTGADSMCPSMNLRPRPMRRVSSPPGAMGRSSSSLNLRPVTNLRYGRQAPQSTSSMRTRLPSMQNVRTMMGQRPMRSSSMSRPMGSPPRTMSRPLPQRRVPYSGMSASSFGGSYGLRRGQGGPRPSRSQSLMGAVPAMRRSSSSSGSSLSSGSSSKQSLRPPFGSARRSIANRGLSPSRIQLNRSQLQRRSPSSLGTAVQKDIYSNLSRRRTGYPRF